MAKIVLDHLCKEYGDLVAVNKLSLEIEDGEFVALLGPSGCGKTTTLKMIVGLETPTSGQLLINGQNALHLSPRERNVGIVFQDYAIIPHMSPYDNIAFGLRIRDTPSSELARAIDRVSDLLDLAEILTKPTRALNVGELQRVAIARTVVVEPDIILLDEPLSNLEPRLRAQTRVELKKLVERLGQTTIYVTHDQVEAMSLANRIAVMNLGRLQQYDTPHIVYHFPGNRFVAGFLGSPPMNFLECVVERTSNELHAVGPGFDLDLAYWSKNENLTGLDGRQALLGIRPEDIRVHVANDKDHTIRSVVYAIEPIGSETIVDLQIEDAVIRAIVPPSASYSAGQVVWAEFPVRKMHLFDQPRGDCVF